MGVHVCESSWELGFFSPASLLVSAGPERTPECFCQHTQKERPDNKLFLVNQNETCLLYAWVFLWPWQYRSWPERKASRCEHFCFACDVVVVWTWKLVQNEVFTAKGWERERGRTECMTWKCWNTIDALPSTTANKALPNCTRSPCLWLQRLAVCVCERERERVCVCVCEWERGRECVCVWVRENVCVLDTTRQLQTRPSQTSQQ